MNTKTERHDTPVLHHVTLKTVRLNEMTDWYAAVVGCVANFKFPGGAWTTNDEANHRVAFLQTPAMSDDSDKLVHTGMHHMAFEFKSLDGLLKNFARLAEVDILPHACLDHGMTTSFYYLDPDGNSVELQSDNFGDWKQSSEWMRTSPDFAQNPIGVEIDPPKMIAALESGVPLAELHKRSRAGEYAPARPGDLRLPL